jgi:hypothetical protein
MVVDVLLSYDALLTLLSPEVGLMFDLLATGMVNPKLGLDIGVGVDVGLLVLIGDGLDLVDVA